MGGFLSPGSPAPPPPPPELGHDPEEAERLRRRNRLARRLRGRAGLITTSRRGVLNDETAPPADSNAAVGAGAKTKLGE